MTEYVAIATIERDIEVEVLIPGPCQDCPEPPSDEVFIYLGTSSQMGNNGWVRTVDPILNLLKADPLNASLAIQDNFNPLSTAYGTVESDTPYFIYVISATPPPDTWTWRNASAPGTPHEITWTPVGDANPTAKCYRATIDDGDPALVAIYRIDGKETQGAYLFGSQLDEIKTNLRALHGQQADCEVNVSGTEVEIILKNIYWPVVSIAVNTEFNFNVDLLLEEVVCVADSDCIEISGVDGGEPDSVYSELDVTFDGGEP